MRTSARPRLPDGDCVFISDVRIVARADAPFVAADTTCWGLPLRRVFAHIAFSLSKLQSYLTFETKRE